MRSPVLKKKSYVCKFRFDRNLQTLNRTLLEASLSLGNHSTSRRVALLSGSFRVRAIASKKKSYVYSLLVSWKRVKESGVVEPRVIRALLFPHQWRDGLQVWGSIKISGDEDDEDGAYPYR
jgi:hypothetical protein